MIHGKASAVLMESFNASPYLNNIQVKETTEVADTSGFQQNDKTYIVGMSDATGTFAGRYEADAASLNAQIRSRIGAGVDCLVTVGWGMGLKKGNPCLFARALHTSLTADATTSSVVSIKGDLQYGGCVYDGVFVMDLATLSATGNTATLDNLASETGSIAAALHVLSNLNSGAVTVKVQHSTDGTVWTDLVTFSALTTLQVGGFIQKIGQGTINRYLRVAATLAGAGNVQALVALGIN